MGTDVSIQHTYPFYALNIYYEYNCYTLNDLGFIVIYRRSDYYLMSCIYLPPFYNTARVPISVWLKLRLRFRGVVLHGTTMTLQYYLPPRVSD